MSGRVLIVGAGPAGLSAAARLANGGVAVTVLERERSAGGIPRHCLHQGFGVRDLHRTYSGPGYAAKRVELASSSGADIRTATDVTGWAGDRRLEVTSPAGRETLEGDAVLLATGCRERPRPARLIPGDRCSGVMTTGTLQQIVAAGAGVGRRAVVVGAEHVSYSALATLRHAGVEIAAMTTELAEPQTFRAFQLGAGAVFGVRARTRTRVAEIEGDDRVTGVRLLDADGREDRVECDTVVLTADWIPERELAATGSLTIAAATQGPLCDGAGRTTVRGVFAAGNVLHGAEPADRAGLEGDHAARSILRFLDDGRWPAQRLAVAVRPPLRWASPTLYAPDAASPLLLRSDEHLNLARVAISQAGRALSISRVRLLGPGRGAALAPGWADGADPDAGELTVRVVAARRRRR